MAKRISEFPEITVPSGVEECPVAFQGRTYRIKLGNLAGIIPLPTKAQIGLGNVDNTSDAAKPVSVATQNALDTKANTIHTHNENEIIGLTATLSGYSSQISTLADQLQSLGSQVFGINNTIVAQGVRLTTAENTVATMQSTLTTQGNQLTSLTSTVSGFGSQITSLQTAHAGLVSDIGTINGALATINNSINNHESRIDILEQEILGDTPTVILVQAGW